MLKNYYSYAEQKRLIANDSYVYSGVNEANDILKTLGLKLIKKERHYQVSIDKSEQGIMLVALWEECGIGKYKALFGISVLNKVMETADEGHKFAAKLIKYIRALEELQKIEICAYKDRAFILM